tara:strand:+ start:205 stop:576 length:372 start_codon:yes stop_codon:yes gene_type:complete
MKLHHTKYKENYKRYILDTIDEVDCDDCKLTTDEDKIKYIFDRFNSEYDWAIERYGKVRAMTEWLQGLALNIPYMHDEIIKLAIAMGSIDDNPTEKLETKVINNYWSFMANIILGFEPKTETV